MKTRRRFLTILAGTAALPALGRAATDRSAPADPPARWQGIALGASAQILIDHPDGARLLGRAVGEIRRLEAIFSLYRPESALSALNRTGTLENPPFELLELLTIAGRIHRRTGGAFDPTIQPLWALHARCATQGRAPTPGEIGAARARTGWAHLRFDAGAVHFLRPAMGLTLNGIAQGHIADRVAAMLRRAGVENVLVNAGEISALGDGPEGAGWRVRIAGTPQRAIRLKNRAIATSAPLGTTFDTGGRLGHIIDPRTGRAAARQAQVSVIAPSAAVADGLSTAFCLMQRPAIEATLRAGEEAIIAG